MYSDEYKGFIIKKAIFLAAAFIFLFWAGDIFAGTCVFQPDWNGPSSCTVDIEYTDPCPGGQCSGLSKCYYKITGTMDTWNYDNCSGSTHTKTVTAQTYCTVSGVCTFYGYAVDTAGNSGPETSRPYNFDFTRPTKPTCTPGTGNYADSVAVTCSNTESGVIIRYTTDGSSPTVASTQYTAPLTFTITTTLTVAAWDTAGNRSDTPDNTYTYTIGALPDTIIDSGPASPTNQTTATFTFHGTNSPTSYQCKLNTGSWASCTSPKSHTVTQGAHAFQVKAVNAFGEDPSPASYTWLVDTALPVVSAFGVQPRTLNIANPTATISWTVTDSGGSYLSHVEVWWAPDVAGVPGTWSKIGSDHNAPANSNSWTSNTTDSPLEGVYWYGIHVLDKAGNMGTESAPIKVTVDKTRPPKPTCSPGSTNFVGSVVVTCSNTESGVIIRYTTDGSSPTVASTQYTAPLTFTITTTLTVAAWDTAGNRSESPDNSYTYTQKECEPGTVDDQSCGTGDCLGTQTRTCQADWTWPATWSDCSTRGQACGTTGCITPSSCYGGRGECDSSGACQTIEDASLCDGTVCGTKDCSGLDNYCLGNSLYIYSSCTQFCAAGTCADCTCQAAPISCGTTDCSMYTDTCSVGSQSIVFYDYPTSCNNPCEVKSGDDQCGVCGCDAAITAKLCNESYHTNCQVESCQGTNYYCSYDGATWGWRTSYPADCACVPPASGDWEIPAGVECILVNKNYTVQGSLHIRGILDLRGTTNIQFSGTGRKIYTYPGGKIYQSATAGFNK